MCKLRFILTFSLGIISFFSLSNVQPKVGISPEKVSYTAYSSIPSRIVFSESQGLPLEQVEPFLASYFEGKFTFSLRLIDTQIDHLGIMHTRYQQAFNGVLVSYAYYVVHSKNGYVISMNGLLFDNIQSTDNNFSKNQALDVAKQYVGAERYMWEDAMEEALFKSQTGNLQASYLPEPELMYVVNPSKLSEPVRLGYKVTIYASQPLSKQVVFVDAVNGQIIHSENLLHFKDVKGTANTVYSGVQTITTDSTSTGYTLKEAGRGNGIETYNMKNSTNFSSFVDFTDKNNVWDTTNVQKDQYALDAHWGAEMTYDYYLQKHQRNSIDNKGYKLVNMVHYGSAFGNAYWDGTRMVFGDGDGTYTKNPLVSLDIIGHEITHGLTANTAKLVSQNEPGALNESFSDIFGATIDWFARPDKANWKVGDEISSVYRSLEDPNSTNHPDTYQGNHWVAMNDVDFGGIHTNNGVQNYWYYLLAQGGNGVNDKGNGYNVSAIGIEKAAMIAFRNLTVYMTSLSNFQDARFYSIQAAIDLFGSCSPEVESVTNAWYAVGVGQPYISKVISSYSATYGKACRTLKVNFLNQSSNAISYHWDFGDNTFSTDANPSHTYTNPGKYTVKLVAKASNGCGILDSVVKVDLVEIHPYKPEPVISEVCSKDTTLTLVSNINGPLAWYASDSSMLALDTAKTIVISNLKKDTSFYVGSTIVLSDSVMKVGETNVSSNIGSYAATVRYQIFDVYKPITIKSVLVNAYTAGDRIVELRDATGKVLQSKTVNIPIGVSRMELSFDVDPGVDYQLGLGGNIGNLGRSNAGIVYPYTIKDVLSIKGSNAVNAGLQYYYSFYDWEIVSVACKDGRQEYKIIQKECNTTGINLIEKEKPVNVFPNPTSDLLTITNASVKTIKVMDVAGKTIFTTAIPSDNFQFSMKYLVGKGVYFVQILGENERLMEVKKVVVE
jgi:Zn-dependent metalloprotease